MKILVTAGPTREAIDPVRFISNRSTGKMGYAVAQAGAERGHEVILVSGPVSLDPPGGARCLGVESAAQMLDAVLREVPACDALVMTAAVADWRPRVVSPLKLKKREMSGTLELERTEDILKRVSALDGRRLVVGFAAETGDLRTEASRKLREKGLDMIVANDVSRIDAGFAVDTNVVTLFERGGTERELPLMSKRAVGDEIVAWLEAHR